MSATIQLPSSHVYKKKFLKGRIYVAAAFEFWQDTRTNTNVVTPVRLQYRRHLGLQVDPTYSVRLPIVDLT